MTSVMGLEAETQGIRTNCANISICSFDKSPSVISLESREYAFYNDSDFLDLDFSMRTHIFKTPNRG